MSVYRVSVILHLAAAFLWLGHMFFWSLFSGPVLKKMDPPATGARLRELSLRTGGLGWPALAILIATGAIMLGYRGIGLETLLSGDLLATRYGRVLTMKLLLVTGMVVYQAAFGHRGAPRAIYLDMLAALGVLGASVMLAGR